jgi:short-subunit dehydrogenase
MPWLEASRGRLVVVSSAAGKLGLPRVAPYAATKHALHGFFDSLRHELREKASNVTVTMAVLGSIDTVSAKQAPDRTAEGTARGLA